MKPVKEWMERVRGKAFFQLLILFIIVLLWPHIIPLIGGYDGLAIEMVIFAIFAMGFNLLLGYTGILSFGHAAFFGLAGYAMGLILIHLKIPILLGMLFGIVLSTVTAVLIGLLIIRKTGIYFAMLTIAFGQMFFFIASRWKDFTGGEDGLTNIPRDVVGIPGLFSIPIVEPLQFYYFVAVIFILAAIVKYKLIHSHFGQVLKTIRENETRARMVGYNVQRYKLASFIISAIYAAVAGTLYGLFLNYMFPQTLDWIRSGDVVIMALVGGMGTFFGPIIGAGVIVALRVLVSIYAKIGGLVFWQFFMGIIFLIFVLFFPKGIWGFFEKREQERE
jgi:branched-chain amino acid transport system permease protein